MTAALKNLMGVVWDRRFWHREGLQACIAEFPLLRKPDLNVIDAFLVMMENGPYGAITDDLEMKKMQLLSTDMVLADAAGAKIMDRTPDSIPYIKMAADLGMTLTSQKAKEKAAAEKEKAAAEKEKAAAEAEATT